MSDKNRIQTLRGYVIIVQYACASRTLAKTLSFVSWQVETFAGKYLHFIYNFAGCTCAVATNDEPTSECIQGIGASSKVKEVPRYQEIVAPRRRPTHPAVLTYSLISRQLASVHGSQHSMNSRPSKIWKLGRTYHRGVASGPIFFTCAK